MWLLLAMACTGPVPDTGAEPMDSGTDTGEPVEQVVPQPTHAEHIQPIWDDACRGCHTPAFDDAELVLADDAYPDLVGVESSENAPMLRVSPGEVEGSYLWHKLDGTHREVGGSGDRMPDGGRPALSEVRLQNIRNWIETGAPR